MTHIELRLHERRIFYSKSELAIIASKYTVDTAVILHRIENYHEHHEFNCPESNGDLVILIVRNSRPITIMFRRSTQTITPESLRVEQIVTNQ